MTGNRPKGYTLVWIGPLTSLNDALVKWASLTASDAIYLSGFSPNDICVEIANEHIDWKYYRISGVFAPVTVTMPPEDFDEHPF